MQNQNNSQSGSLADNVRSYCKEHYIIPARTKGVSQITIRSGDVHKELGYKNRLPLVCAALGAEKFENMARVKRLSFEGPVNGANTKFTFRIIP